MGAPDINDLRDAVVTAAIHYCAGFCPGDLDDLIEAVKALHAERDRLAELEDSES